MSASVLELLWNNDTARVAYGDKWAYYDKDANNGEWVVMKRKTRSSSVCVYRGVSQLEAVRALEGGRSE